MSGSVNKANPFDPSKTPKGWEQTDVQQGPGRHAEPTCESAFIAGGKAAGGCGSTIVQVLQRHVRGHAYCLLWRVVCFRRGCSEGLLSSSEGVSCKAGLERHPITFFWGGAGGVILRFYSALHGITVVIHHAEPPRLVAGPKSGKIVEGSWQRMARNSAASAGEGSTSIPRAKCAPEEFIALRQPCLQWILLVLHGLPALPVLRCCAC